ncbi:hypothetical protein LENED_002135 [Lentinula edodes]|uniref:Uncharacterized protein n=1 Tax=Lentinula edodes TaxID=5353 RepID=A0A1Q3E037_LENED|nr:hypothetical protein LENED_002135 [Lentinula edodes]
MISQQRFQQPNDHDPMVNLAVGSRLDLFLPLLFSFRAGLCFYCPRQPQDLTMLSTKSPSFFILFLSAVLALALVVSESSALPVDAGPIQHVNSSINWIDLTESDLANATTHELDRRLMQDFNVADYTKLGYMTYVSREDAEEYVKLKTFTAIPGPENFRPVGQGAYLDPKVFTYGSSDQHCKVSPLLITLFLLLLSWLMISQCVAVMPKKTLTKTPRLFVPNDVMHMVPQWIDVQNYKESPLLFYKPAESTSVQLVIPFQYLAKSPRHGNEKIHAKGNPKNIYVNCYKNDRPLGSTKAEKEVMEWETWDVKHWPTGLKSSGNF